MRRWVGTISVITGVIVAVSITVARSTDSASRDTESTYQDSAQRRSAVPLKQLSPHPLGYSKRVVDGRSAPSEIPIDTAYRTFFRTLTRLSQRGDERRYRSYITYALTRGLALKGSQKSKSTTEPNTDHLLAQDPLVDTARKRVAQLMQTFNSNGTRVETLSAATLRSTLRASLGDDGAEALDQFVLHVVRRQIKLIY